MLFETQQSGQKLKKIKPTVENESNISC